MSDNLFQLALLERYQCQREALVSERAGMQAENEHRLRCNNAVAYGMDAFQENADSLRALAPDPHQFA